MIIDLRFVQPLLASSFQHFKHVVLQRHYLESRSVGPSIVLNLLN